MNCAECQKLLTARLDGLLNGNLKAGVDGHLHTCAACRAEEQALRICTVDCRDFLRSVRSGPCDIGHGQNRDRTKARDKEIRHEGAIYEEFGRCRSSRHWR